MKNKAISPMVATILLIAFTVAIGGVISVWMTGYTRTSGATVSSITENQTACIGTYPDIISVTSNAILVTNRGSENITNLVCFASNGTQLMNTSTLIPGNTTAAIWNRSSGVTGVLCTGKCRTIGISGECQIDEICWV